MRLFFVCNVSRFRRIAATRSARFHEISQHKVHVFCLADGDLANVPELRDLLASVTAIPLTRLRSRITS